MRGYVYLRIRVAVTCGMKQAVRFYCAFFQNLETRCVQKNWKELKGEKTRAINETKFNKI